jgi:mono/diheme cytochrome c family protein
MLFRKTMIGFLFLAVNLTTADGADPGDCPIAGKYYCVAGGEVDAATYNGFRRYHAACNHCHGPDGLGSTFAPSLVEQLPDREAFRRTVLEGVESGPFMMKGFVGDPNVAPFVDDIYAYLQARADGALARGRPGRFGRP